MSPARATSAAGRPAKVWVPAAQSGIYQSVRSWIADEGHDPGLFDELCFGIGALPSLLAHGQVFSHLAELLDAPVFADSANGSPSPWLRLLPQWRAMLRSWPEVCERAKRQGVANLLAAAKPMGKKGTSGTAKPRHPMDGQGITNAPVAAALWCAVHSKPSDPQTQELARRFELLQSMFLALVLEMRWRSGATVDDYLHFEPQPNRVEFAPIPVSAAAAGRAIRWLSAPEQAPLLLDLPHDTQPQAFAQGMRSWAERLRQDTQSSATRGSTTIQDAAQAYPLALANFFEHWDRLLDASYTPQRRTRSTSAQSKEDPEPPAEPVAEAPGPTASSGSAANSPSRPGHSSLGGLAPSDAQPRELKLDYDRGNHLRRTSRQKWQQMRAATRVINLPWALEHYTPRQINALAREAKGFINSSSSAATRQGALLTWLCVVTGRAPAELLDLRLFTLDSKASDRSLDRLMYDRQGPPVVLLFQGVGPTQSTPQTQAVLLLPTIEPKLADGERLAPDDSIGEPTAAEPAHLATRLRQAGGQHSRRVILPVPGLAPLLLAMLSHGDRPRRLDPLPVLRAASWSHEHRGEDGLRVFPLRPEDDPKEVVTKLRGEFMSQTTEPLAGEHWEVSRLRRQLGSTVEALTGDATQSWLICGDESQAGQARLHYTQHGLRRLAVSYLAALNRMGLDGPLNWAVDAGAIDEEPRKAPERLLELLPPQLTNYLDWHCGAPFIVTPAAVQELLSLLSQKLTKAPEQGLHEVVKYHNLFVLHFLVTQGLCTGIRAITSPVSLLRAAEQQTQIQGLWRQKPTTDRNWQLPTFCGLADKETYYSQRARLVALPPTLLEQIEHLRAHNEYVLALMPLDAQLRLNSPEIRALFALNEAAQPREVSVAWVEAQLLALGHPWPANFTRGFLRTALFDAGVEAADLTAFLGHEDGTGGAITRHSSFDLVSSRERLLTAMHTLHSQIGLRPIRSALLRGREWHTSQQVILAPLHRCGRRVARRHPTALSPFVGLPTASDHARGFWKEVEDSASEVDRRELGVLLRLLDRAARRNNPWAAALLQAQAQPPSNRRASTWQRELSEGEKQFTAWIKGLVERGKQDHFHRAASWFRLIMRASQALQTDTQLLPQTPLVVDARAPASPFQESAVLALPLVDGWRHGLHTWLCEALALQRQAGPHDGSPAQQKRNLEQHFGAEAWACALLMSAALHGMLLGITQLSLLLARFGMPHRRSLPVATKLQRAHLDFELPSPGSVSRQLQRWWFDPITELIWLSAPEMPPPSQRALTLGSLTPFLRRITTKGFQSPADTPTAPASWSDLVCNAEVWWLARASRSVVASQRRQVATSSILTDRWQAIVAAGALIAPHGHDEGQGVCAQPAKARTNKRSQRLVSFDEYESLARLSVDDDVADTHEESGEEALADEQSAADFSVLYPWIGRARDMLLNKPAHDSPGSAATIKSNDWIALLPPEPLPIERNLAAFAQHLHESAPQPSEGEGQARSFIAAAQALLVDSDLDLDQLDLQDPSEAGRAQAASALAELLGRIEDLPQKAGATALSRRNGLMRLASFLGLEPELASRLEAAADGDSPLTRADARVLTFEEYDAAMLSLENGPNQIAIVRPSGYQRGLARLLLTLCFRLGLRPCEAYGLRLLDVAEDCLYVRVYEGYGLKSNNAWRRVPLFLLSANEREHFKAYLEHKNERRDSTDRLLSDSRGRPAQRAATDALAHAAMREAGADPNLRLYHGRHSCASWLDLAIRCVEHPQVLEFFADHEETRKFLQNGQRWCEELFGSLPASRGRISFALARWVGHVGPAVTHMHYLHFGDLIRAAVVQRQISLIPKAQWIELLGLAHSAGYDALRGDQPWEKVISRVRRERGWVVRPISLPAQASNASASNAASNVESKSKPARLGPAPLFRFVSALLSVPPHAEDRDSLIRQRATWLNITPEQLSCAADTFYRRLEETSGQDTKGDPSRHREAINRVTPKPLRRPLRAISNGLQTFSESDKAQCLSDLEFMLNAYDRRDRDFHVKTEPELKRLRQLFERLGITPEGTGIRLRRPLDSLPDCATPDALGSYLDCPRQFVSLRLKAKASTYAKWCGLAPVSETGESWGGALAVVVLAALSKQTQSLQKRCKNSSHSFL